MNNEIKSLQQDVSNHTVSLTTVLQRALIVAHTLGDNIFQSWIRKELDGYSRTDEAGRHRQLNGRYVVVTNERNVPIDWGGTSNSAGFASGTVNTIDSDYSVSSLNAPNDKSGPA